MDATDTPADEAEAPDLADVEFRLRKARAGIPLSVFCGLGLAGDGARPVDDVVGLV